MRTEELVPELASLVNRLEFRIKTNPRYARLLAVENETKEFTIEAIEDAIAGLVILQMQLRKGQLK